MPDYVRVRARNACGTGPASNEGDRRGGGADTDAAGAHRGHASGMQVVVVSSATVTVTVRGRIELHDRSVLIIRDRRFNHVADYASQFDLWAYDDSRAIIERSTLDVPVYTSWHFFDRSALQMTHVISRSALWTGLQQHARGTYAHVTRAYGTGADGTMLQVHHTAASFIEMVFPPRATIDEAFPAMAGATAYRFRVTGTIPLQASDASIQLGRWTRMR